MKECFMSYPFNKSGFRLFVTCVLFMFGNASAESLEDRELARAMEPDSTPEQFYSTAIHEAGGAYKEALRDCLTVDKTERLSCRRDAKVVYDNDMLTAREARRISRQ
jgi:hypothetical protein